MLTLTPGRFLKPANQIEACDFCQVLVIVVRSMNQTVGHLCVLSASNVEVIVLFCCMFMCRRSLSLTLPQNGTQSELQRCVSQWQCLY